MKKVFWFWFLAIIITLGAAKYQRTTGPTYPKKVSFMDGNAQYKLELIRSHGGEDDCPLSYDIADTNITATLKYRLYRTNNDWTLLPMTRSGNTLNGSLPHQPPAGKVEYEVSFFHSGVLLNNPDEFHTVVRFKGHVPLWILLPHILFMFFAMMFSNLAGIMAVAKYSKAKFYTAFTLILLLLGGFILGPLVQLYAFGELWTGIPFGWDLTDNKTLIAVVAWVIAFLMNRKKEQLVWIIIAAIVTILVFSIPHSMFGSELNYATGTVTQG